MFIFERWQVKKKWAREERRGRVLGLKRERREKQKWKWLPAPKRCTWLENVGQCSVFFFKKSFDLLLLTPTFYLMCVMWCVKLNMTLFRSFSLLVLITVLFNASFPLRINVNKINCPWNLTAINNTGAPYKLLCTIYEH